MATYYVDGAVGDDANAGTSAGSGNAWATIDKAMNTVAGGDIVYVKSSATYTETVTIDTAGAAATGIQFIGYDSTTDDGGIVTIDAESTRSYGVTGSLSNTYVYYTFKNFKVVNTTSHGWYFNSICRAIRFINCHAEDCGSYGFYADFGTMMAFCTATSNSSTGLYFKTGQMFKCSSINNGVYGIWGGSFALSIIQCVSYNSTNDNIYAAGNVAYPSSVISCTVDGANSTTRGITLGHPDMAINNIIYDHGTGLRCNVGSSAENVINQYNLFYSNTNNYSNTAAGDGEVVGDPDFTDETTQDYSLGSSSAAQGAGAGFGTWNIGAYQEAAGAGGGGGMITHPGMEGGING